MSFHVRPARASDKTSIAAFTADTFTWGDYVAQSFDTWLETPGSRTFVATIDEAPVALSRVVSLSGDEIWLHGARVHPHHRRRGLGTALNAASLDWGRDRGAIVARLMVEDWNEAARSHVEQAGYRRVATWFFARRSVEGSRPSRDGPGIRPPEPLRSAPPQEVEGAYMSWSTSELARAAHGLVGQRWHMRRMTVHDLFADATARMLWEAPSGWISIDGSNADDVWVRWMMSTAGEADTLVAALMTKLRSDGVEMVGCLLPKVPWLVAAFESSGFEVHSNAVWELALS